MSIENVVLWYEKNVNYRLTTSFLNLMVKVGIIKNDIDLDFLNLYLLERYNDDFTVEDGKYKIKANRIPIISKFKDEITEKKKEIVENVKKPVVTFTRGNKKEEKNNKKFKIENIGGNRLKLVKL